VTKNPHFTHLIIACHKSITVMYFMPMELLHCYLQPTVGYCNNNNNIYYTPSTDTVTDNFILGTKQKIKTHLNLSSLRF